MGKQSSLLISESKGELLNLKKQHKNLYAQLRLHALLLLKEKTFKNRSEVALALGKSLRTIERWVKTYKDSGITDLLNSKAGGARRSCMSLEAHEKLAEKLQDAKRPLRGYWDAVDWLKEHTGEIVCYTTLRNYIITNFKTKLKWPRKSHYKKDDQAIEAFKKTS